jgi:hypothetical protein
MSEAELKQAIQLIKSGDKQVGKNMLINLVRNDPYDENAWLWLASVTSAEQRIYALQKALAINPHNEKAREYLNRLKPQPALHENPPEREPAKRSIREQEREPIREAPLQTENIENEYLRPDGVMVFKPSWDRVLLTHFFPRAILVFCVVVYNILDSGDPVDLGFYLELIAIIYLALGVSFLIRMSGLYHVKIKGSVLIGPGLIRYPWVRHEFSIKSIDFSKTDSKYGLFGYYRIFNKKGSGIYLTGFDKETLLDMLEIINKMQTR